MKLPQNLPEPKDDGKAKHLVDMEIPNISLESTAGSILSIRCRGRQVFCFYPMTGVPGSLLPRGWDSIPGARGCTPQLCSIRESYSFYEKKSIRIFCISTQCISEQLEARSRLKLNYELLSDKNKKLEEKLSLPMFSVGTMFFYKRLTMVIDENIIKKVFYPVFPPDAHYVELISWLEENQ